MQEATPSQERRLRGFAAMSPEKKKEIAEIMRAAVARGEDIHIHFHTFEPSNLRALLESWIIHLRAERKAEGTVRLYATGVRAFLAWCDRRSRPGGSTGPPSPPSSPSC